jgi:hypothetical protein
MWFSRSFDISKPLLITLDFEYYLELGFWNLNLTRIGYWLLVTGYWLLVIGYWLLVIGYWLLVTGYWLLLKSHVFSWSFDVSKLLLITFDFDF